MSHPPSSSSPPSPPLSVQVPPRDTSRQSTESAWLFESGSAPVPRDFSLTAPSSPAPTHRPRALSGSSSTAAANQELINHATGSELPVHIQSAYSRVNSGVPQLAQRAYTAPTQALPLPHTPVAPVAASGFNGSTAREFFKSHLRAIAFTARVSHLAGAHTPGESCEEGAPDSTSGGGTIGPGEMTEEQFMEMARSLGRDESLSTIRSMFQSLQQFRTLLVESRTLAGADLRKEEAFARIASRVRSVVAAEAVVLLMVDPAAESLYACAAAGPAGAPIGPVNYSHGPTHSFGGHVLRHRTSLNLRYAAERDPRYDPDLARRLGGSLRFRSVLAVPVFNKATAVIAVLLCINKRAGGVGAKAKEPYFTDQDQSVVEFLGILAGHTIENALLFDEAVQRRRQTETLLQTSELLSADLQSDKIMSKVVQAAYMLVSAERITLYTIDAEKEQLVSQTPMRAASRGHARGASTAITVNTPPAVATPTSSAGAMAEPQRLCMNQGLLGFCATSGKPVNLVDARLDWRFDPEVDSAPDCPTVSMLVVPVTDHMSRPIAVIMAVNKRASAPPPPLHPITGGSAAHAANTSSPSRCHLDATAAAAADAPAAGTHVPLYFTKDEEALLQSMAVSAGVLLRKARLYEEAVSTRKKTEITSQISELMSADLQSDKIMSKVVQAAYALVQCEVILLYMVDEAAGSLVCEVGKDGAKGARIPLGHGVAGHTALTGRSLNIADAAHDWRFDPSEHYARLKNPVQTILAIPVKDYLGKNVGVLEVINKRSTSTASVVPFTSVDEDALSSLAFTAGAVLRKSKLYDEAVRRRRQMEQLLQINEIMAAEVGSEKVMQRMIEASYALVDAERITLFAVDPRTDELVCQVSKDPFFQGVRMAYGHGIVGHVALTRRSLNILDAYADPRFNQQADLKTGYRTNSILTVPVTDRRGQSVAVIQAVNRRGERAFTSEDVLLLESMAVNAGQLLQKSRLFDAAVVADRKSRALVQLVMTATREDQSTEWIMHEIGRVAYDALCADRVYIFFVDNLSEQLTCVVGPEEEGWMVPIGRGIAGFAARTGDLVNVDDAPKHPKFDASVDARGTCRPKSILCQGVKNNEGEVLAVVYVVNKRSAARHAQMQWVPSAQRRSSLNVGPYGSSVLSSPIRPQGPPPSQSDAFSNGLPPLNATLPLMRKRSSVATGGPPSPWLSLRAGWAGHDSGYSSSGSNDSAAGPMSPTSALPSPARHRAGVFEDAPPHSRSLAHGLPPLHMPSSSSSASTVGGTNGAGVGAGVSSESDLSSIESFTSEDEDVLRALCAEVRSLLLRHVRETVLEMNQLSMNDGVYSLMDMCSGVVSGRTAATADAAHAVSQTHQTTSGKASVRPVASRAKRPLKRQSSDPVIWPMTTSRFGDLLSLDFNVWTYSSDELLVFAYEMFAELRLVDEFQIVPESLRGFLMAVRDNYHDNPFHNFQHGFCVLHFSYLSLRLLTNSSESLTQQDVLALMIASLCHDIDHPGNTNSYEINTESDLALIHNDLSVLEAHHAYMACRLLRATGTNILSNLRKDTFQSVKKTLVGAILATDMVTHFSECRTLDTRDAAAPFNINVPTDRQALVNMLIHSADLSAQCLPTDVAKVWEERITREFQNQAAREQSMGITIAEFMRDLSNPLLRRQNQVNFIDVVLIPWWRAVTRLFPGFKQCYKQLFVNRNYYDANADSVMPSPELAGSDNEQKASAANAAATACGSSGPRNQRDQPENADDSDEDDEDSIHASKGAAAGVSPSEISRSHSAE